MAWSLLLILSIVWGSSFILIKKALISFTPLELGAARVSISFLAFLPLLYKFRKEIPWDKTLPLAFVGLCGSALPAILYAIAQTQLPSSVAGVVNSLTPIFTFLIAIVFFKGSLYMKQLLGIILGFGGTSILFFARQDGELSFPIMYGLLLVIATFSYGISANLVSKYLQDVRPSVISVVSFCIIGPFMLVYLLSTDFIEHIVDTEFGWMSFAAVSTLSLIGTFLANILFFRLIQLTDAVFSSAVSFIIPIVALLWGLLDGEWIGIIHVLALALILSGVFLIKRMRK